MQAFSLARQRLRARMQHPSTPRTVQLAHGMVENGRGKYLPVLSSALAQEILSRGYDARTLEHVYSNRPAGPGIASRIADRMVLNLPVHRGLRERREALVGEMYAAAVMTLRRGAEECRVLCAPCGLASEMVDTAVRMRSRCAEAFAKTRFWGLDLDPDGTILPEARRSALAAGLRAEFIREDLRRYRGVSAVAETQGPFHVISCVGLAQRLDREQVGEVLRFYSRIAAPGATLLIDRWQTAEKSQLAAGLGIRMRCDSDREFRALLEEAGFTVEREHPSGEGGCVLVVARKTA